MAVFQFNPNMINVLRRQFLGLVRLRAASSYSGEIVSGIVNSREKDMPVEMKNPYEKPKPKCILCQHQIKLDFKNVRLLSQFVSPYTGRTYGRHITGLCEIQHKKLLQEIKKSQHSGLMAYVLKDPHYFKDPKLYDEENPLRPHRY